MTLEEQLLKDWEDSLENPEIGYSLPGFPELEKKMSGILPGLYLVGGKPHSGKTTFMLNLANSLLHSIDQDSESKPDKICFISFNDDCERIFDRIVPFRIDNNKPDGEPYRPIDIGRPAYGTPDNKPDSNIKKAYFEMLEYMKAEKFDILDISQIDTFQILESYIENTIKENRKTVFFIDGILNLIPTMPAGETREKAAGIASKIKILVAKYEVPIFVNVELRKEQKGEELGLESFRESNHWGYVATVVFFIEEKSGNISLKMPKNKNNGEVMPWHTMKYKTDHRRGLLDDIGERYTDPKKSVLTKKEMQIEHMKKAMAWGKTDAGSPPEEKIYKPKPR